MEKNPPASAINAKIKNEYSALFNKEEFNCSFFIKNNNENSNIKKYNLWELKLWKYLK